MITMKKLLFILIFAGHAAWDAAAQELQMAQETSRDTTSIRIEEVVVAVRGRNRAKRYFKRYVRNVPSHGWYVGFAGRYDIDLDGFHGWRSQGTYVRNHIPGDDANRNQIDLFSLNPDVAADSINSWQIQRYILLAGSIAERAAGLGNEPGVTMSYRGGEEGMNVFWISDGRDDGQRNFRTRIYVHEASGIIGRSESTSLSPSGVWSVTAHYAVFEDFIYPMRVTARFEHRDSLSEDAVNVKVDMTEIIPRRFQRDAITKKYWEDDGEPGKKVLKQRQKIMRTTQPKY